MARPLAVRCAGSRTPTSVTSGGRPGARSSTTYSTSRPWITARGAVCPGRSTGAGGGLPGTVGGLGERPAGDALQRLLPGVPAADLVGGHAEAVGPLVGEVH